MGALATESVAVANGVAASVSSAGEDEAVATSERGVDVAAPSAPPMNVGADLATYYTHSSGEGEGAGNGRVGDGKKGKGLDLTTATKLVTKLRPSRPRLSVHDL